MKRGKLFTSLVSICLFVILAAIFLAPACKPAPTPAPGVKVVVIKGVYHQEATNPFVQPFFWLRDKVKEKSKGELIIDIIGGPETIPATDTIEAVGKGTIDIVSSSLDYGIGLMGYVPSMAASLTADSPAKQKEIGLVDFLNKNVLNRHNMELLGMVAGPYYEYYLFANKPIGQVEDIKGLKIRTSGANKDALKALRGEPMNIPWTETYTALEQGMLNGLFSSTPTIISMSLQEVTKYRCGPSIIHQAPNGFLINLGVYNGLPQHLRKALLDAMQEIVKDDLPPYMEKIFKQATKDFIASGGKLIEFSAKDTEAYLKAFKDTYWSYLRRDLPPELEAQIRQVIHE